ncbi:histidinol-phosphate transaminase [Candidatus Woesearchaeota archaeon]|nr:histidinol-phosphate transaminase [Candidatus Woesearchaeota archaeon]
MLKPKKSVIGMQPYRPPIEGRDAYLRLDFNENLYGATQKLNSIKLSPKYISVYPEYSSLLKKLSSYFKTGIENILPSNGADEGIKTVFDTFVDRDDEVIMVEPTFPMFRVYAQIAGAKIKSIPYGSDFSFPLKKALKEIKKSTKLVVIANPNNPTGTLLEKSGVIKILKKAKNSAVLIDEAYADFSGVSCINLIKKYRTLIVVKSFSKVFGIAGVRLGTLLSDKHNISCMKNVRSPYSVNSLAVLIGSIALSDVGHARKYVLEVRKNKIMLVEFLRKRGIYVYGGHANFILAKFNNPGKLYSCLKKKGILIRRIPIKGYVRITIGRKDQMKRLMKCIGDCLE